MFLLSGRGNPSFFITLDTLSITYSLFIGDLSYFDYSSKKYLKIVDGLSDYFVMKFYGFSNLSYFTYDFFNSSLSENLCKQL